MLRSRRSEVLSKTSSAAIMSMKGLIVLAFAIICTVAEESHKLVGGINGKSVRLNCDLPISDPPRVQWVDFVFNTDSNPSVIFNSKNKDHLAVNPEHDNAANLKIAKDFSLTISNLNLDRDPGNYICESKVNNVLHKQSFYLTVGAEPRCTGKTDLVEGAGTILECQSEYSGINLSLEWFRGSEIIDSEDNFDVRMAKRSLSLMATAQNDQQKYTCRMKMGDIIEECSLTLDVKYLVRDLKLTPETETLRVGDELMCSASGNPAPIISLLPLSSRGQTGDGWQSLVIEPEWLDKKITVECTASNSYNDKKAIISKNITVNVIGAEEPLAASAINFSTAIIIGIIIVFILTCLVVVIIIIVMKQRNQRRPKGAKPLPTKDEISQSSYGQLV